MQLPPLPLVEKDCGIEIEDLLPEMINRSAGFANALFFSLMYRRLSIAKFFITGVNDFLMDGLAKSAYAFAYYLEKSSALDACLSKMEPFFDAVASGNSGGIVGIKRNAPRAWNNQYEYEDDFLYMAILMAMTDAAPDEGALKAMVDKYEAVLSGAEDMHFPICKALFEKDADAFNTALVAYLEHLIEKVNKGLEEDSANPDHVVTTAKLSIEGMALLVIAESRGITPYKEYPLIPSMARKLPKTLAAPKAWQSIDSYYDILK